MWAVDLRTLTDVTGDRNKTGSEGVVSRELKMARLKWASVNISNREWRKGTLAGGGSQTRRWLFLVKKKTEDSERRADQC